MTILNRKMESVPLGLTSSVGFADTFPTGEGAAMPNQNPKFLIIFANSSLAAKVA